MGALIPLIAQLTTQGIGIYQQMHQATEDSNITKIAALIPIAASVYTALQEAGDVLQIAQAEGWAEDDPRWAPVFEAADKALAAAEARLATG